MNEELSRLLKQYDDGDLDEAGKTRLRQLVATPEGRKQVLTSNTPEAIFLADEIFKEPDWQPYWEKFSERLETQNRWQHKRPARLRTSLALAATLIILLGTVFILRGVFVGNKGSEQVADESFSYALIHRQPAEVLPDLHTALSDEASFTVDNDTGSISVTGSPAAVQRARRTLEMLDREPLQLPLQITLLDPINPGAIQQIDALPTKDIDLDAFHLLERLEFTTLENQQFREVIDNRYEISCFIKVNIDATEAHIVSLTVYDRENRMMLVRASDLTLASGWTKTVQIQKDSSMNDLVAAISLLPSERKEDK